jgi:transcriptional regulator with XRE-family HTH domain
MGRRDIVDPEETTLGQRIKKLRNAKGYSLSQLADLAHVSKGYIHELENDPNPRPSAEVLYDLALALDTSIGYLLGRMPVGNDRNLSPVIIPELLEAFAIKEGMTAEMKQPRSLEDWRLIYYAIQQSIHPIAPDVEERGSKEPVPETGDG